MKSSHAVLAVALLFAAAVLLAPASSAASYHSFTWDPEYEYRGITVSTNAGDNARIPDGYPLEITIASDVYDTSAMDIHIKDSGGSTVRAYVSETGSYCLDIEDDLVLVLKNFVLLPAEPEPEGGAVPGTVDPSPVYEPEAPEDPEPHVPDTAAGYTWDAEAVTGLLLAISAFAAAAVLIYGVFAAFVGGEYYGKP